MALHDELADLRATVGAHIFDDPVAFRAAFDDFVPEGAASTGEVSLLVGAIATGALQRLHEQLQLGADPQTSIATQGDLLARDRGTTESSGARWALSVLAHAAGWLPADMVPTRPTPGPDSVETAGRPAASTPPVAPIVDSGPTAPASIREPSIPAVPTSAPDPPRRGGSRLLAAALVVLAIVAVTALALLFLRDDDDRAVDTTGEGSESASGTTETTPDEEVVAQLELTQAGETARLQLVVTGTDATVVMLAEQDGEYVEVDRAPTSCPFLDTSYDAGLEDEGGGEIFIGWQNEGNEPWGEYGQVLIDEDRVILYGVDDGSCPSEY